MTLNVERRRGGVGIGECWGRWPWKNAVLSTGKTTSCPTNPLPQVVRHGTRTVQRAEHEAEDESLAWASELGVSDSASAGRRRRGRGSPCTSSLSAPRAGPPAPAVGAAIRQSSRLRVGCRRRRRVALVCAFRWVIGGGGDGRFVGGGRDGSSVPRVKFVGGGGLVAATEDSRRKSTGEQGIKPQWGPHNYL